jgi:hypothetical protein
MFEKLKNSKDARQAAIIAAGVFGGLFAYRLLIVTLDWWTLGWSEITALQQTQLGLAVAAAACAATALLVRSLLRRRKHVLSLRATAAAKLEQHRQTQRDAENKESRRIHNQRVINEYRAAQAAGSPADHADAPGMTLLCR